ncbi:MAG: hypothetical protein WAT46_17875, partial [Saprospiraceae bacterium]
MIRSEWRFLFIVFLISNINGIIICQDIISDTIMKVNVDELVVTATRNERMLSNVTVPTLLINHKLIQLSGNVRLNDVL